MNLITEEMKMSCDVVALRSGEKVVIEYSKLPGIVKGGRFDEDTLNSKARTIKENATIRIIEPIFG